MLRYTTLGHSAGGGQSAAGGRIFPPLETVDFLEWVLQGLIEFPFWGGSRNAKICGNFEGFPINSAYSLGWECNDPCTVTGEFLNQFGS